MQDNFQLFKTLDGLRAHNLSKKTKRLADLPETGTISDYLQDGEEIFFELSSINFWLKVNFKLYSQPHTLPLVEGYTELRIDKNEKMTNLKKKIQILMIQLWGSATP